MVDKGSLMNAGRKGIQPTAHDHQNAEEINAGVSEYKQADLYFDFDLIKDSVVLVCMFVLFIN